MLHVRYISCLRYLHNERNILFKLTYSSLIDLSVIEMVIDNIRQEIGKFYRAFLDRVNRPIVVVNGLNGGVDLEVRFKLEHSHQHLFSRWKTSKNFVESNNLLYMGKQTKNLAHRRVVNA